MVKFVTCSFFYITVALASWCLPLRAQVSYTLSQCLEASDTYSPLAKQPALIEAAHQSAVAQLRTNLLPQAALNGQATWQSAVTSFPIKLPNIDIPTINRDQYKVTLDLSQVLWDGGQIARQTSVQEAQTKIEQQKVQIDRYAIREQVIQFYCAVLLAQKQTEALAAAQKDVVSRKIKAEEQVKNGTAIPAGTYSFEARLLELEQQTEEVQARKHSAQEGLALLTGLPISDKDVFSTSLPGEAAATERPELLLFSLQQQSTLAQENLVKIKSMPRFNAVATLGYGRPGLNFLSNEWDPYAILGVNMRWNLSSFYTNSIDKERQQYRIQSQRIAAQREQFLLQNAVRQRQQLQDIDRLGTALRKDQEIIGLREKVAATAAVQLENGVLTPSEYLTETTQITTAKLNKAIHEVQLLQAQLLLAFVQGKL